MNKKKLSWLLTALTLSATLVANGAMSADTNMGHSALAPTESTPYAPPSVSVQQQAEYDWSGLSVYGGIYGSLLTGQQASKIVRSQLDLPVTVKSVDANTVNSIYKTNVGRGVDGILSGATSAASLLRAQIEKELSNMKDLPVVGKRKLMVDNKDLAALAANLNNDEKVVDATDEATVEAIYAKMVELSAALDPVNVKSKLDTEINKVVDATLTAELSKAGKVGATLSEDALSAAGFKVDGDHVVNTEQIAELGIGGVLGVEALLSAGSLVFGASAEGGYRSLQHKIDSHALGGKYSIQGDFLGIVSGILGFTLNSYSVMYGKVSYGFERFDVKYEKNGWNVAAKPAEWHSGLGGAVGAKALLGNNGSAYAFIEVGANRLSPIVITGTKEVAGKRHDLNIENKLVEYNVKVGLGMKLASFN